jgi:hypothetical protein
MPFLFLIAGFVMTVSAVRGTQDDLIKLLKDDFTGSNNFLFWIVSILLIGALGYIGPLRPLSRAFLVLVIVVLFLKNGGVFTQFVQALHLQPSQSSSPSTAPTSTEPATSTPQPSPLIMA